MAGSAIPVHQDRHLAVVANQCASRVYRRTWWRQWAVLVVALVMLSAAAGVGIGYTIGSAGDTAPERSEPLHVGR